MYEKVIINLKENKVITIDSSNKYKLEKNVFLEKSYEEQIIQLKEEIEFLKKRINSLSK